MKVIGGKNEAKKRRRDDSQDTVAESPKRAKVHAQRKFAQGAAFNSPSLTVIKDKVRPPANVTTRDLMLSAKRPNTEDFLTFLCFRRTSILPPKLDFFKDAFKQQPIPSSTQKTSNSSTIIKNQGAESSVRQTTRKSEKNDLHKKIQTPVQALRRKYQEQRLAKQKATNVTKLAQKVKGKNMIRTRSSTLKEEKAKPTKKITMLKERKAPPSGLRSGLQRAPPAPSKNAKKPEKVVEVKNLRSRFKGKVISKNSPVKAIPEKRTLKNFSGGITQKKIESSKNVKTSETTSTKMKELKVNVKRVEGLSDFSSDDNEPLLAVRKDKAIVKGKKFVNCVKEELRNTMKTRSHANELSLPSAHIPLRPTRKTKEAAAIYMEMITKKLVSPEKSGDEDRSSVDSFPELPNAKRNEQRETEIKAKARSLTTKKSSTSERLNFNSEENEKIVRLSNAVARKREFAKKNESLPVKGEAPKKLARENHIKKIGKEESSKKLSKEPLKKSTKIQMLKNAVKEDTAKKVSKEETPTRVFREELRSRSAKEEQPKKPTRDEYIKKPVKEESLKKEMSKKIIQDNQMKKIAKEESSKKMVKDEGTRKVLQEDLSKRNAKEEFPKKSLREEAAKKMLQEDITKKISRDESVKKASQEDIPKRTAKEPQRKAVKEEGVKNSQEDTAKKTVRDVPAKKQTKEGTTKKVSQEYATRNISKEEQISKQTKEEVLKKVVQDFSPKFTTDEASKKDIKEDETRGLLEDLPKKILKDEGNRKISHLDSLKKITKEEQIKIEKTKEDATKNIPRESGTGNVAKDEFQKIMVDEKEKNEEEKDVIKKAVKDEMPGKMIKEENPKKECCENLMQKVASHNDANKKTEEEMLKCVTQEVSTIYVEPEVMKKPMGKGLVQFGDHENAPKRMTKIDVSKEDAKGDAVRSLPENDKKTDAKEESQQISEDDSTEKLETEKEGLASVTSGEEIPKKTDLEVQHETGTEEPTKNIPGDELMEGTIEKQSKSDISEEIPKTILREEWNKIEEEILSEDDATCEACNRKQHELMGKNDTENKATVAAIPVEVVEGNSQEEIKANWEEKITEAETEKKTTPEGSPKKLNPETEKGDIEESNKLSSSSRRLSKNSSKEEIHKLESDVTGRKNQEEHDVRPATRGRKQEEPDTKSKKLPDRASGTKKSNSFGKKSSGGGSSTPCNNWLPPTGTGSNLVEAPTFYPTEKEFQDPLEFFERIRPAAESFGLCRIVPPSTFKPDCKVSDDMRFTAYNQYVHRMFHRWGPNIKEMMAIKKYLATQSISFKQPPWIGGIEVDLPRLYQSVQNCGGLMKVMEKKKWHQVADMMRIPKAAQDRVTKLDDIYCKYLLPYDTLSHVQIAPLLPTRQEPMTETVGISEALSTHNDYS